MSEMQAVLTELRSIRAAQQNTLHILFSLGGYEPEKNPIPWVSCELLQPSALSEQQISPDKTEATILQIDALIADMVDLQAQVSATAAASRSSSVFLTESLNVTSESPPCLLTKPSSPLEEGHFARSVGLGNSIGPVNRPSDSDAAGLVE